MSKRSPEHKANQRPISSVPKRKKLEHGDDWGSISSVSKRKLTRKDYTVGWICPLEVEQVAALEMLDEEHEHLPQPHTDHNVYTLGSIGTHHVVIAGLHHPSSNAAATVVTQMRTTFPQLRFGLLVGIGGGVPVNTDSGMIRLGHVVVSKPVDEHSGAVQYDRGKAEMGHFRRTGALAPPPAVLLNASQDLAAKRARLRKDPIVENIKRIDTNIPGLRKYKFPGSSHDRLFKPEYRHLHPKVSCDECGCDPGQCVQRDIDDEGESGDSRVVVHRGTIASGELVIKNGQLRDHLAKANGVLCFEMEAAGSLADFPCIVVRGISDYCDSHKNDRWHGYAAAVAAAYARQLFFHMPSYKMTLVNEARPDDNSIKQLKKEIQSAIDNIDLDLFLGMLLAVDQEEKKSTIPTLDIGNPTFYWIFRNIDFVRWTDRSDPQVLWLSGPSKCNIQQVSSYVVEHKKAGAKTRCPVLYFFCSTAAEERSIVSTFVHTLLTQIISCSPEDRKLLIAKSFIQTLVKWLFEPTRAKDEFLHFYQKLSRSVKDPPAVVGEILAASPNALWFALQAALTHEQEDMLIVIEGLDKIKYRKGEFIKGVHELVVHLKERISGFKSLLTSGPQGEIKETFNGLTHIEYDKERKECLASLRFENTRYGKISQEHKGSFQWIWQHDEYRNWSTPYASRLLYVQGKPGSGKSTLVKYFSDNLLEREAAAKLAIVAKFFYSHREGQLQTSHYSMLRSILFDILDQDESFFYHQFQSKYREHQVALTNCGRGDCVDWSYNLLKELLSSIQNHSSTLRLYLIIDAVDESDDEDRRDILNLLFDICSNSKCCSVKILMASRPVGQLELRRSKFHNFIRLQDETKEDISCFAYSMLKNLNLTSFITQAIEYMVDNAQGVFLWVQLVGEELLACEEKGYSEKEIFEFLKSLPTELGEFYTLMFQKLEREQPSLRDGVKMFRFVLFGKRPLTANELLHTLGVSDDAYTKFSLSYEEFQRRIPSDRRIIHCGGNFLEIRPYHGDGTVQVIHQTVREFFLRSDGCVANSKFRMIEKDAHKCISITCVKYLMIYAGITSLAKTPLDVVSWTSEHFENYAKCLDGMPFAKYALCYLNQHIAGCQWDPDVSNLTSKFINEVSDNPAAYLLEYWLSLHLNNPSLRDKLGDAALAFRNKILHTAVRKGCLTATDALLTVGTGVNAKDEKGRTPLSSAAGNGHAAMVKLLLKKWAYLESKDRHDRTPLSSAAGYGHTVVVKLLLEKEADLESKDDPNGRTPLSWAAGSGHGAVVELLLERGADLKSKDRCDGRTPLSWAAGNGHEAVVELLLERSANLESKDQHYNRTPLSWAAGNGHEAVVKLLLGKGADLETKGRCDGWTPLSWAAGNGHEAVVELLLEKGADLESKDQHYNRTPLSWAAGNGHEAAVKLLLENGANLKSKDRRNGRTPLSWAAANGHAAVVKLLLKKGADLESEDRHNGRTPLSWAAGNGHEAVVRLLLTKGADLESEDQHNGWTPLSWAAANGHEAVVKWLLEEGTDLESQDRHNGRTALLSAAGNGHEAMVRLLLENGVNLESKDRHNDRTALSLAAGNGRAAVVRLLLMKGAYMESKDQRYGRTPLLWAVWNGQEAVVELLLEKGANLEAKNRRNGRTPLSRMAGDGQEAIVRLLLEKGADLESKDDDGRTPLSWAAGNGHEAIVRLLLKKGANWEPKDRLGQLPLLLAAANGHEAVVKLLLEKGADLESRDDDGRTPLSWAAGNGQEAAVKLLLERHANLESKDNDSRTPLSWAAGNGQETAVKLLLNKGANLRSRDRYYGRTPLSWAAENGYETVARLLFGKEVNLGSAERNGGRTLLSRAAENGKEAMVKLLLEKGANLEAKDDYDDWILSWGRTPLSWAAGNGHDATVRFLLERGADLESVDNYGRTPLSWAAGNGQDAVVRLLLEKHADLESKDNDSRTPLSWAAGNGQEAMVRLLLKKGADQEPRDRFGQLPQLWAAKNGHETVRLLFEKHTGTFP